MPVMRFDNFDVGIVAHHFRRLLQQLQHQVDSDAEVRGEHNANLLRGLLDRRLSRLIKTGGADNHVLFMLTAEIQIRQRRFRAGEIDQDIEIINHRIQTVANRYAQRADARQLARVAADQ